MYITNTTEKVYELFENYDKLNELEKLEAFIILSEEWSVDLINEKNEINPSLSDENFEIFNPESVGLEKYWGHELANVLNEKRCAKFKVDDKVETTEYLNMKTTDNVKEWLSKFEKLNFVEKIDVISELLLRFYGEDNLEEVEQDTYDLATSIKNYKKTFLKENENFPYEIK